jgi:hypothetical protein
MHGSRLSLSNVSQTVLLGALALGVNTGCSSLSAPFNGMKDSPMTVYRLQNFEPAPAPTQAAAPGGFQLPPQIQQWISAGASLLPPGLLPPGLIPGAPAAAPVAPTAPRFHNFPILAYQVVDDASTKADILDVFGHQSNFANPGQSCMYAELGFAIAQPNNPTPADILVSLSCQQVQAYNFGWPYQQTGLTPDTDKKFADIVKKVFQGR